MTVPSLILRLIKNAPLTAAEMDGNLTTLRDFCNSLSELLSESLNTDGTLKDGAVDRAAVFGERVIDRSALNSKALPFFLDTGGVNSLIIAPSPVVNYEDEQIFFIRAANTNTGNCTLLLTGATPAEAKPLRKRGGVELDAGDINKNQVFCCAYYGGAFEVIATSSGTGSSSSSSTGGFSGFSVYQPTDTPMPVGPAYPYTFGVFQHGLQVVPSVELSFVCVTTELGYTQGDIVPLAEILNSTGLENFAVKINATNITATMSSAPYIRNAAGAVTAMTLANWSLRVVAAKVTSASTPQFPALTFSFFAPFGAFAYGEQMFVLYRDGAGAAQTVRIDTPTNNVFVIPPIGSPYTSYWNAAPFLRADGVAVVIFSSNSGLYQMPQIAPYTPILITATMGSANYQRKPCYIKESAGIQQIISCVGVNNTEAITAVQAYANATYVHGGSIGTVNAGAVGAAIDFRSTSILNLSGVAGNGEFRALVSASDYCSMVQYNLKKKRIYVIAASLIHIFEIVGNISGYSNPTNPFLEWLIDAGRYAKLQYKKSISIAGIGLPVGDYNRESQSVDFDVVTGDERAVVFCKANVDLYHLNGSVTRIPWKE